MKKIQLKQVIFDKIEWRVAAKVNNIATQYYNALCYFKAPKKNLKIQAL